MGTRWGGVDILKRVVREGCTEKVTFEESPGRGIGRYKGPGVEAGWVYPWSCEEVNVAEQSEPGRR